MNVQTPDASQRRAEPDLVDPLWKPHFDALKMNRILVLRCLSCETYLWPPREFCDNDQTTAFEWVEVPQEGSVYSYSVVYRAFHPWFVEHVPYAIIVADVLPGVRITGNRFGSKEELESIECEQPVVAHFRMDGDIPSIEWK